MVGLWAYINFYGAQLAIDFKVVLAVIGKEVFCYSRATA